MAAPRPPVAGRIAAEPPCGSPNPRGAPGRNDADAWLPFPMRTALRMFPVILPMRAPRVAARTHGT